MFKMLQHEPNVNTRQFLGEVELNAKMSFIFRLSVGV